MRVLELLAQEYQIDEKRLSVSGDGSNRPAGTNDTPEGRALNRRVELVILDQPAEKAETRPLTNLAPTAD
jgi:chemotaxis protein MotB